MNLPTEYIEKFAECYCNRLLDRRISTTFMIRTTTQELILFILALYGVVKQ